MTVAAVWSAVAAEAERAGLDAGLFGPQEREVVDRVVHFLMREWEPAGEQRDAPKTGWLERLKFWDDAAVAEEDSQAVRPIILCGEPGTGKTTFLYVLDTVLRREFDWPDPILPTMQKEESGRSFTVNKRRFNGRAVSLLSVQQWSKLLHFYHWRHDLHRLDHGRLRRWVRQVIRPMGVVFADEVEMVGYSPTLPTLAQMGVLVVGTSNQYAFKQLEGEQLPAHILRVEGADMRFGRPEDAVVDVNDGADALFTAVDQQSIQPEPRPAHRRLVRDEVSLVGLNFRRGMDAPLLEGEWFDFLREAGAGERPCVLLLDHFSLRYLRTNYSAVMRFVQLFDAVEQLGVGVLVRNREESVQLSQEALNHMKVTIYTSTEVPEHVRRKAVAGVDRCMSRLGQAGHRARQIVA